MYIHNKLIWCWSIFLLFLQKNYMHIACNIIETDAVIFFLWSIVVCRCANFVILLGVGIGSTVVPQVLISPVGGGKVSRDFLHSLCGSPSLFRDAYTYVTLLEYCTHVDIAYIKIYVAGKSVELSFYFLSLCFLFWLDCSLRISAFSSKVRDVLLLHKKRRRDTRKGRKKACLCFTIVYMDTLLYYIVCVCTENASFLYT